MSRASCFYQLTADHGAGYCIGAEGDDFAELLRCLGEKYGPRLASVRDDQTGETVTFAAAGPADPVQAVVAGLTGAGR